MKRLTDKNPFALSILLLRLGLGKLGLPEKQEPAKPKLPCPLYKSAEKPFKVPKLGEKVKEKDNVKVSLPSYADTKKYAELAHGLYNQPLLFMRKDTDFQIVKYVRSYFLVEKEKVHILSIRSFHAGYDNGEIEKVPLKQYYPNMRSLAINVLKFHRMGLAVVTPSLEFIGYLEEDEHDLLILRDLPGLMPLNDTQATYFSPYSPTKKHRFQ